MANKIVLNNIIPSFAGKKVLIVGDVMVDTYLWGNVNRISPEAPVPVVACHKRENRLGGAANVALNIASLDAVPVICSVIGEDEKGKTFLDLLEKRGIVPDGILATSLRQTTSKTRVLGQHQQLLRVDQEQDDPLTGELEEAFKQKINEVIAKQKPDVAIIQDYDKGAVTPGVIDLLSRLSADKGFSILVDPKKRNFDTYRDISVFKPNFKEFTEGLKLELAKDDFEGIFDHAKSFLVEKNISHLLLTLSEKGIFVCDRDNYCQIPAQVRDVADVSGAGDTVISVAALCWSLQLGMKESAAIANLAGSLVCERVGVVPVKKKWLGDVVLEV